jgi:hypothetical protein
VIVLPEHMASQSHPNNNFHLTSQHQRHVVTCRSRRYLKTSLPTYHQCEEPSGHRPVVPSGVLFPPSFNLESINDLPTPLASDETISTSLPRRGNKPSLREASKPSRVRHFLCEAALKYSRALLLRHLERPFPVAQSQSPLGISRAPFRWRNLKALSACEAALLSSRALLRMLRRLRRPFLVAQSKSPLN